MRPIKGNDRDRGAYAHKLGERDVKRAPFIQLLPPMKRRKEEKKNCSMDRLVLTLIKKKKKRKKGSRKEGRRRGRERERGGEKVSRNVEAKIALSR